MMLKGWLHGTRLTYKGTTVKILLVIPVKDLQWPCPEEMERVTKASYQLKASVYIYMNTDTSVPGVSTNYFLQSMVNQLNCPLYFKFCQFSGGRM